MGKKTQDNIDIIKPARRTDTIEYAVRDIALLIDEVKKAGKQVFPLNIGDPVKFDFNVPAHLIEAAYEGMKKGFNGYSDSSGIPEAIDAIRREAQERKGIKNVINLFISSGASEAIEICLSGLVDSGESVLLPSPGYPLYSALTSKLELNPIYYNLDEENNWYPDIEDIKKKVTPKTRAIVVINPNNPTGSLYSRENLEQILEISRKNKLVVFSDEIYDKIIFDNKKHIATASLADDVPIVTFGGLSKCYIAPGWRIGWAIFSGPQQKMKNFIDACLKITRARLCANHPLQWTIKPALDGNNDHLTQMISKLQKRRDMSCERLNAIEGIKCVKPEGAFYAFPSVETELPDKDFVYNLIRETGVVVVHGSGFGEKPGTKHFRIVTLPQEEILDKAYTLISEFMKKYTPKRCCT